MGNLTNSDDVQRSMDSFESASVGIIKIPESSKRKTPIYILSAKYSDGYAHWVKLPDGRDMRVVCGGGLEGKGFAESECLLCSHTLKLYREAKEVAGKKTKNSDKESKAIKTEGNQLRAKYAAEFIVAKGEMVKVKDKKSGKSVYTADFEECEVGILPFSEKQYKDLIGLRESEEYPFIKTGKDLMNRVIYLDKQKRDKSQYATIVFSPSKRASAAPDIGEVEIEDFDTDSHFEIDTDEIEKAYGLLTGGEVDDEFDDDDFEVDDEDDTDDDVENSEDEFEDDVPWDEDDEEEEVEEIVAPKRTTKKTVAKKTTTKSPTKKTTSRRKK